MGSSCSSGQGNKDKDNSSSRSEDSPSYQATDNKKEKEQDLSKRDGEKQGQQQQRQGSLKSSQTKDTGSGGKPPTGCTECTPTKLSVSVVEVIPKEAVPQVAKIKSPSPRKESKIPAFRQPSEKEKKIVVYVCAADSQDSKVEKSLLHSEIYPQLRQSLQKSNFELHLVDLHWNLQDKTPEPSELCLHELERQWERSYLVPVIFLNDRLGAPLLPKTIEVSDYESVLADEEQSPPSRPLDRWYILDTQAEPPCYRLLPPSTLLPALKSMELKEREKAMTDWRKEVEKALGFMLSAWETDVRDTYLTTVVEQEVQRALLMSPREVRGRCLWMYRACHSPGLNNNSGPSQLEQELARRLARLKSTIRNHLEEGNIFKVTPASGSDPGEQTDYLGQVSSHLSKRLGVICEQIVEEHTAGMSWGVGGAEVGREARWHRRAALRAASLCSSLDRHTILSTVESVHQQQPPGVSVFTGPEGSGKTGLLARLATSLKEEVIYRQVGTSRYSSTLVCLLLSVLRELGEVRGHVPHNIESYGPLLYTALEKRAAIRPTTLIIDGIDQFREFGLNVVTWLPRKLPPGAKLIVSLSDTSDLLVSRLKTHLKDTSAKFIQVPELTKPEATMMLSSSLLEYNHSLDSSIRDIVLTALTISTLPLYIKVLAWETSWCSEYNLSLEPQGGLREQLSDMLQQLEGMLGKEQVEKALSLLICSKWGLTDSELLDILSSESTFHTTTTALPWAGAYLFWSKLTRLLGPFLEHGEAGEVRPSDPGLGRAARERYRSKIPWAATLLYRYFSGQLWEDGRKIKARSIGQPTKFGETYNVRKLEELPYVTFKAQGSAAKYTLDADWLFDKLCGSTVHQVLEDVYLEPESEDVAWLRRFLEQRASPLEADGRQLYSQLALHRAPPPPTALGSLLSGPPRIVSLIQTEVDEEEEVVESGPDEDIDFIGRLPHNHNFVVTISTVAGQISVWDVVRCRRVRRLSRIPQPTTLHMVDDYRSVVLCGRELRVYDLNTGSLLTKLKGVMNQKMPYFGLHDSDHLVALSRNRMYVNLMNLTTGDLVTTFKAGEDRFLNSLLVSGDGRILVCGDETQKPMPLLVWNLSSRKLLYDLRIPHHDFVTRMSAITHNGAYVCCVAKEVDDEATPNYIVVYDLQSGTLFKKWKKGVDTTAVDISSTESSVISGHADRTIIVWDLITGNRRWIFRGHKGPVSHLRLSPSGSVCLSTGDQDPSIRLWDLATGKLVAVWSPEAMTRTCDLTDRHVVLSQVDKGLTTLYLAGPGHTIREQEVIYGDADRMGEETESSDQ